MGDFTHCIKLVCLLLYSVHCTVYCIVYMAAFCFVTPWAFIDKFHKPVTQYANTRYYFPAQGSSHLSKLRPRLLLCETLMSNGPKRWHAKFWEILAKRCMRFTRMLRGASQNCFRAKANQWKTKLIK